MFGGTNKDVCSPATGFQNMNIRFINHKIWMKSIRRMTKISPQRMHVAVAGTVTAWTKKAGYMHLLAKMYQNFRSKFRVIDDQSSIDEVALQIIAEREKEDNETPFMVADLEDITRKVKEFKKCLPRVKPFYAVKSNDEECVLRFIAAHGINFDCASWKEIEKILYCGVCPSRIVYANPYKFESHLRLARKAGVDLMTFDSECELQKIKEIFPEARLLLRLFVNDGGISQMSKKYGVFVSGVRPLLRTAMELGLNIVGVCFHVGSPCTNKQAYVEPVKLARDVFMIAADLGIKMHILDVGGGFPGNKYDVVAFSEVADLLNKGLDQYFPPSTGVEIIAEPGKYFVSSAFDSFLKVIAVKEFPVDEQTLKHRKEEDDDKRFSYYLSTGAYGLYDTFRICQFDRPVIPLKRSQNGYVKQLFKSTFWGPTCSGNDVIVKDLETEKLNRGDWLKIEAMGDYSFVLKSDFNGYGDVDLYYVIRNKNIADLKPEE